MDKIYNRLTGSNSVSGAVAARTGRHSVDSLPMHLPVVREGWLYKRGGSHGGRTNWKRRYFMLLGDVLYYMESRSDRTPRGRVLLRNCACRNAEEELKRPHAFGIYNTQDTREIPFFCASDSAQETADWLIKLAEAASGTFVLPGATSEVEASLALGLIAQIVRDHEPRYLPQAELEVAVIEARGLASTDHNGLSDPYALLHCGSVKCRTRCVPKTLNPQVSASS